MGQKNILEHAKAANIWRPFSIQWNQSNFWALSSSCTLDENTWCVWFDIFQNSKYSIQVMRTRVREWMLSVPANQKTIRTSFCAMSASCVDCGGVRTCGVGKSVVCVQSTKHLQTRAYHICRSIWCYGRCYAHLCVTLLSANWPITRAPLWIRSDTSCVHTVVRWSWLEIRDTFDRKISILSFGISSKWRKRKFTPLIV